MARVKKLIIRNLLGWEELEVEPGKINLIEGPNASGKSSILEVAKAILGGGHDATLLRKGAEEGEGVLILGDDGGDLEDVQVRKRVTEARSTLDVRHPTMGTISAAQTFVNKIHDPIAVNPVRFIREGDDRVEILVEALGAKADTDALLEVLSNVPADELDAAPEDLVRGVEGLPAIDAIERIRKAVYNARTGVNRIVKDQRTTADQLRETLPEDVGDPEAIEKEIQVAESAVESMRDEASELVGEIREDQERRVSDVHEERDEKVAELQRQIQEVREDAAAKVGQIRSEAEEGVEEVTAEYDPRIQETKEEIATLRERLKASEGAARAREMILEREKEADRRESQSEAMTSALERLDDLKAGILDELSIDGAEFRDGELYVDGVHFDRLNTTAQVEIAVQIAENRVGDLGLVCIDDLELLDAEHFEAMVERLKDSPLQAFLTRVSDDAFEIRTDA